MEKTPQEIRDEADRICALYDEAYYEIMNRILDEVREEANNPHKTTPNNLGQLALRELGFPKIP